MLIGREQRITPFSVREREMWTSGLGPKPLFPQGAETKEMNGTGWDSKRARPRWRLWSFLNIKWRAVLFTDTFKKQSVSESPSENQLVCSIVANAFKCRIIPANRSVLVFSNNPRQKTLFVVLWQLQNTHYFFLFKFIYISISYILNPDR